MDSGKIVEVGPWIFF